MDLYQRTVADNPWIPVAPFPKQRQFLLHSFTREVFYGGAARGGKTFAALMGAAQFVDVPGYSALILRSTFPDLMQPGGLIPTSKEWWYGRAAWNQQQKQWTFPSGATVTFGHLGNDDDVHQYRGSRHQYIFLDEATQHTEWRYLYLSSRLDRPNSGPLSTVPLRLRAASNPGGKGHEWVRKRFIDPKTRPPRTVFIPAFLADNPTVDQVEYIRSLDLLDPVTRAQLLKGDWSAFEGGRFLRAWFKLRYELERDVVYFDDQPNAPVPLNRIFKFMVIDPAARAKKTSDYTAISTFGIPPRGGLMVLDVVRGRFKLSEIPYQVELACLRQRPSYLVAESNGFQDKLTDDIEATIAPIPVKRVEPEGREKLNRATPVIVMASKGRVWLPDKADWLDDFVTEVVGYTGDEARDPHDDQVDTLAYAGLECLRYNVEGEGEPLSFGRYQRGGLR